MQNTDDTTITQRFAAKLTQLGITSEVEGDGLIVEVEGVRIGVSIDDFTPHGDMWRLYLSVDVGEVDDAAAAAAAEVVQSVVAMYGRRLLKGAAVEGAEKHVVELEAENARLLAELEKPVLAAWDRVGGGWVRAGTWAAGFSVGRRSVVAVDTYFRPGWQMFDGDKVIASGAETGDAGRHAADIAAAPVYRLIGGVHPAPDVVPNG